MPSVPVTIGQRLMQLAYDKNQNVETPVLCVGLPYKLGLQLQPSLLLLLLLLLLFDLMLVVYVFRNLVLFADVTE